jgi:hypothetical protein
MEGRPMAQIFGQMRSQVKEPTHQQNNQKNPAQFHSAKTSTEIRDQRTEISQKARPAQ